MQIIGHRGACGEAPENTLSGFNHLKSLGIRAVEFDIRVSHDGQLVVIHDDSVERTTNGIGLVHKKTINELAALDACSHFNSWLHHDGVPSLAAVLTCLADFDHLQLEVKVTAPQDCAIVAQQLPLLCQTFGSRAVTTSFNPDYLRLMQQTAPHITRGLLVEDDFKGDIIDLAQSLGCKLIAPHHQLLHLDLVQQAHQQGLVVSTWTVNQAQRMIDLQNMGLDSLITDYPSLALKTLAQDGFRSSTHPTN